MISLGAFCSIFGSVFGFTCLNASLQYYQWIPIPKGYTSKEQLHKWRNAVCSLVHAVTITTLSFASLPDLWSDFVQKYTQLGEITQGILVGYVIYDSMDLAAVKPLGVIWPVLLHHAISAFFGSMFIIFRRDCLGYGILSCTVELNSIALHLRQLILIYGSTRESLLFKANNIFNIITFTFHRIPTFILICICSIVDRDRVSSLWYLAMFFGSTGLLIINLVLFKRLIRSDFFPKATDKKCEGNGSIMDR